MAPGFFPNKCVRGYTDLQHYKLEAQLTLLPEVVQAMGYDNSRFEIADLLDFAP